SVATAEEALACFRDGTYNVVIADVQLPGTSGLELVKRLRAGAPGTAVVIMTGEASVATAVQSLKDGAVDYLIKPINPGQLRQLVTQLVAERPAFLPNSLLEAENH